ncbi:hypothetical protein BSF41_44220 [Flavobacterium sp. ACN2]|uniref:hypothetical protein n=1 Tax=Flavobacterium sp. ACN2 TaxID=1975676 RepID=UPI000BB2FC68|nr:hypothetical protein [Flavobacterium sp. ACN2]PBI83708.1 hypothetical protein BSF41_44220 [Flavobacterium sp. ACN2]
MKILLSLLLIITLSFQGYSQKKIKKKTTSKATATPDLIVTPEMVAETEKIIPDTLYIQKGKQYIFLVDVNEYSQRSTEYASNDDNTEKEELKLNFPKENLEFININKYTYVLFENKQRLDITAEGKSFQALAYWSGKTDEKVKVREGTRMATEFVAEQLKSKKESSYVVNARKYKKEVASLQSKNEITSKSKEVMKHWLNSELLSFIDIETDNLPVSQLGTTKLKTMNSYFLEKKGVRIPLKSINFNKEGLPTSISSYDEGKVSNIRTFIYNDGLLTKIIDGENLIRNITYIDNKMIISENISEVNPTYIFWLENGKILEKRYILMIDDKFSYMNSYGEEKIENNCISHYINNVVWTNNCSTANNKFPLIYTYTTYEDKEMSQFIKFKIEKKNDTTFEKYYSKAKRSDQNDDYKLLGTLHLNDFNLVDTYIFTEDNETKTIKVDYTFYE